MASTSVRIDGVGMRYRDVVVLHDVRLDLHPGEFFTLLGASGCGKTTLLRIIAGFLRQVQGHVLFDGRVIDEIPAHQRNTGMVFQSYAIFPHLSVRDNIAYGLRTRGLPRAEIDRKVDAMLEVTRLHGLGERKPKELSGGQQQRVVLARALVIEPDVLLMDEPLSNLDAEMRLHLRYEIRALQRQIGVTTIYVTHDQEEALSLSDRIAVMRLGRVEQVGTPHEIFNEPANRFVAGFVGESNFMPARRTGTAEAGRIRYAVEGGTLDVPETRRRDGADEAAALAFRPHAVQLCAAESASLRGQITDVVFTGNNIRYQVRTGPGSEVSCLTLSNHEVPPWRVGDAVGLRVPPAAITAFPQDTA